MRGSSFVRALLALTTIAMQVTTADAQSPAEAVGIPRVIVDHTRATYRGRVPHTIEGFDCSIEGLRDSVIVAFSREQPIPVRGWRMYRYRSLWAHHTIEETAQQVYAVVGAECSASGVSVLVERLGYHLELDAASFHSVTASGGVGLGVMRDPLSRARLTLTRADGVVAVANADSLAAKLREEIAAVKERERVEQERVLSEVRAKRAAERVALVRRYQTLGATCDQAETAADGRVSTGLPAAAVRELLGEPVSRTTETTRLGTAEIWRYRGATIVFESGRVVQVR